MTEQPTGVELYAKTCLSMVEFFNGFRELAKEAGEPYDTTEAAEEIIRGAESGQAAASDELVWADLSAADKAQFKRGIYAAANGSC